MPTPSAKHQNGVMSRKKTIPTRNKPRSDKPHNEYMGNGSVLSRIAQQGEELYFGKFKSKLEKSDFGNYAFIDVDSKDYVVDESKLKAFDLAVKKFGEKLFYIVQVGTLSYPTRISKNQNGVFGWTEL